MSRRNKGSNMFKKAWQNVLASFAVIALGGLTMWYFFELTIFETFGTLAAGLALYLSIIPVFIGLIFLCEIPRKLIAKRVK